MLEEAVCTVCTYDSVLYYLLQFSKKKKEGEVRKPTGTLEEEF